MYTNQPHSSVSYCKHRPHLRALFGPRAVMDEQLGRRTSPKGCRFDSRPARLVGGVINQCSPPSSSITEVPWAWYRPAALLSRGRHWGLPPCTGEASIQFRCVHCTVFICVLRSAVSQWHWELEFPNGLPLYYLEGSGIWLLVALRGQRITAQTGRPCDPGRPFPFEILSCT